MCITNTSTFFTLWNSLNFWAFALVQHLFLQRVRGLKRRLNGTSLIYCIPLHIIQFIPEKITDKQMLKKHLPNVSTTWLSTGSHKKRLQQIVHRVPVNSIEWTLVNRKEIFQSTFYFWILVIYFLITYEEVASKRLVVFCGYSARIRIQLLLLWMKARAKKMLNPHRWYCEVYSILAQLQKVRLRNSWLLEKQKQNLQLFVLWI